MHEEAALLKLIAVGDDTARLIYADWLEDRGDPRSACVRELPEGAKFLFAIESVARVPTKGAVVCGCVECDEVKLYDRVIALSEPPCRGWICNLETNFLEPTQTAKRGESAAVYVNTWSRESQLAPGNLVFCIPYTFPTESEPASVEAD